MKTYEQRMRDIASSLPTMARTLVPGALIDLLIDLCKVADKVTQEKQP